MKILTAVCFYAGLLIAVGLPILDAEESAGKKLAGDQEEQRFEVRSLKIFGQGRRVSDEFNTNGC